jgi:phosphoribosyl 1,2-cyclic phosphate phosphodiesterase
LTKAPLKITILGSGTSQGVPVIGCDCEVCTSAGPRDQRLRVAILISRGGVNIAVDAGPDFRQQMLRAGVKSLDAVLLTHEHNDHIIGLDDVRPFNFMQWKKMPVFATPQVQAEVRKRFAYIFEKNPYPGSPMLELRTISKAENFEVSGINITPIEVLHGELPVMGFRLGDFTYLTDVKTIAEDQKAKARHSKVLVLNALHHKTHHSHLNLREALAMIEDLAPEQAYLTHISHRMGLHAAVSKTLPKNVALAYDGLEIQV